MANIKKYSPIIYEGVPDLNPESVAYREFWDEQIERCKNGYKPKGMDAISGKHYYYLNFYKILGNSCLLYISPSPRDKRQSRMPSSA